MNFIKELIPYIIIVIIVILIRLFIISPAKVDGLSMYPTLDENEVLIIKKYDHNYERFDIVVFKYNDDLLVKRIVGFPGEHIKYVNNKLYINNEIVEEKFIDVNMKNFDIKNIGYDVIPSNMYFVIGDNRNNSVDSRMIGLINSEDIVGSANFSIFPFNKFGIIKNGN